MQESSADSRTHLFACLALSAVEISARQWRLLVERCGSEEAALEAPPEALEGETGLSRQTKLKVERAAHLAEEMQGVLDRLEGLGVTPLPISDPSYPSLLKQISDPPGLLYVRGNLLDQDRFGVAIVGSRNPRSYGQQVARRLAEDLARAGVTVISGGARGIDSISHDGAIKAGGRTIAVLGCGIDVSYPAENKALFERIAASGAVVAEFPPGATPEPWRFPQRNRIISGLSRGVIVCDAAEDSGSLITASCAAEQNRDVFAVPGNIDASSSRGPHKLIKEGAKLIESAEDVLSEYGLDTEAAEPGEPLPIPVADLSPGEIKIVELLDLDPMPLDAIIDQTGLTASEASVLLTFLEMKRLVRRMPGPSYVRVLR